MGRLVIRVEEVIEEVESTKERAPLYLVHFLLEVHPTGAIIILIRVGSLVQQTE